MVYLIKIIVLFLVVSSCTYNYIVEKELPKEISFKQHVIPIFNSKCSSCHDNNLAPNLKEEDAYESLDNTKFLNIKNPKESILLIKIEESPHKPNLISDYEYNIILGWIKDGAKNN